MFPTGERFLRASSGIALVVLGIWTSSMALGLPLGSIRSMGPGYFPLIISIVLIILGTFNALSGWFRPEKFVVPVEWRPFIFVSAGVLTFALLLGRFGLLPAIIGSTFVFSFADARSRFPPTAILATVLGVAAYVVFIRVLGLPLVPWRAFW